MPCDGELMIMEIITVYIRYIQLDSKYCCFYCHSYDVMSPWPFFMLRISDRERYIFTCKYPSLSCPNVSPFSRGQVYRASIFLKYWIPARNMRELQSEE